MAHYSFLTIWRIEAPIDKVYDAIEKSERWPSWWKGVVAVQKLEKGDKEGVGSVYRYTWKSALPYKLNFEMRTTVVEPPARLEGDAFGELVGTGRWHISQKGEVTTVRYEWKIATTKAWMNLLAPIARPVFAWNHDVVMRQGGVGLARLLGARLVFSKNKTLS